MSEDALRKYQEMQVKLTSIREAQAEKNSPEENDLLSKMGSLWETLSEEERETIIADEEPANPNGCPWPHYVEVLYGVPVTPIEQLPKKCLCGADIEYADEVCFVNGDLMAKFEDGNGVIVESGEVPFVEPSKPGLSFNIATGFPLKVIEGADLGKLETFVPKAEPVPGVVKIDPTIEVIRKAVEEVEALNPPPTELTEVEKTLVNRLLGRWEEIQSRMNTELVDRLADHVERMTGARPEYPINKSLLASLLAPIATPSMIHEVGSDGTQAILGCKMGSILIMRPNNRGMIHVDLNDQTVYFIPHKDPE